jgi:L,D-transpeptidase catalytic domain
MLSTKRRTSRHGSVGTAAERAQHDFKERVGRFTNQKPRLSPCRCHDANDEAVGDSCPGRKPNRGESIVATAVRRSVAIYRSPSEDGRVTARFPAAVGRSVLPTPTGRYFLVELLKQPDPNGVYGPYAFGTSAFSKVLYHFGGAPGQIGIHGTDEHGSIGHSVGHGCIRLRNRDIVRLAHVLPLGTPITILD